MLLLFRSIKAKALPACAALGLALAAGTAPARAWVDHTQTVKAAKTTTPPALSAALDDPAWAQALRATAFYDLDARVPAPHDTVAYFLYDDRYIYAAFRCEQKGVPFAAAQTVDHAGLENDDRVTLMIDTSTNGIRTYYFRVSPSGVKDEGSSESTRFAPNWDAVAQHTADGYNVMMRIPISALHIQPAKSQDWRVDFGRSVTSLHERYTWSYDPTMTGFAAQFFPIVSGIAIAGADSHPRPHADVFGLFSGGNDRRSFANGFQNGVAKFDTVAPRAAGIDVTYPITNTLSAVGTLNPDFSNIEQDQTQIAPNEFQRAYTEYRPFFAQGASYVNSIPQFTLNGIGEPLFYTPSIGIFDRGLKLEGNVKQSAIGALNVSGPGFNDSAFGYGWTKSDNSFGVFAQSVMAHHTDIRDEAEAFELFRSNPRSGEASGLQFEQEQGTTVASTRDARYVYATEYIASQRFVAAAAYKDVGPEFNPVDGYTIINDIRGPYGLLQYNGVGTSGGAVKTYELHATGDRYRDRSGAVRDADLFTGGTVTFKNLLALHLETDSSILRWYDAPYPVYTGPHDVRFDQSSLQLGYNEQSANTTSVRYGWGPFGGDFLQQPSFSTHQQFGVYGLGVDYAGSIARGDAGTNSQWLRRVTLSRSFGRNSSVALAVRNINGRSMFAEPGTNIAFTFQRRLQNDNLILFAYGTPASAQTLHRIIFKYVIHAGGAEGS